MSSKRKASACASNTVPPAKRQKVSSNKNQISKSSSKSSSSKNNSDFTSDEIKQLLQLFNHLQSQGIQNQTLDRCIFDAYLQLSKSLNPDDKEPMDANLIKKVSDIVNNKILIPSNMFFEQFVQLKAQIAAMRLLSRDMPLSLALSDLCHGIDNPHSWQRQYIDPLQTQNESTKKHSKYDLMAEKKQNEQHSNDNDDDDGNIIIDNSPQMIEELVYQNEYDGMKKLISRRRMLKDYVFHYEEKLKNNKNNKKFKNNVNVKNSKQELNTLDLIELQNKLRNDIIHSRLDQKIYDNDNAENEALLDSDLFVRTAQIGLHFDPHINSANHPPTMATSQDIFPFYYEGTK